MSPFLYLDYAASAPLRAEAAAAEAAYEESDFAGANPNSLHTAGRRAARALDDARRDLARLLGGGFRPADVVFTSGGTENNNLALTGLARAARQRDRRRNRVLLSAIEHDSGLDVARTLKTLGFVVEQLSPSRAGVVEPDTLKSVLGADVALVSVMAANNETGIVQPVDALARAAHTAGALYYCDAAQGFGKIELDVSACDAVGIAGHKLGAPVGTGALVVRGRVGVVPLALGGGQERGIRPGTQDVRGALALAAAAKACCRDLCATYAEVWGRAERLYAWLCAPGTGIAPSVPADAPVTRLPGMVSVIVEGVDSQSLVLRLDDAGIEVSAASACAAGSAHASHVLLSMGLSRDVALGSLRISFDERVGDEELKRCAEEVLRVAAELRARR